MGPLKSEGTKYKHILSITDAFTRWVELVPIENKEAITVAKALFDNWICRFGHYRQSVSDGGGEFDNEVLKELTKLMKSKHHIISPYSPSVNGIIERVHRSLGAYIRSFCEEQTTEWVSLLPVLTFSLNTKVHSSTKLTPYFLTYGEHPIFPWTPHEHITYSESEISDRIRMLQYAQKLCYANDLETRAASKRAFDVKSKFKQFKIKDEVLLFIPSPPVGANSKFYNPWRGIYNIIERTSNNTYIVRKKGGRTRKAHVNRLRYYDPTNSPNDPQVQITVEDDVEEIEQDKPSIKQDKIYEGRITRSRTKDLNRISSAER